MIHTIETLPIVTFVKIAETNNLDLLLTWKPKYFKKLFLKLLKINLSDTWQKIGEEYAKHEDSKKNIKVDQLKIKLSKLQGKYYAIISALEVLKYGEDADMLKILESYGYKLIGEYWKGLETIYKQVTNLKSKIDAIEDEILTYTSANEEKEVNIHEILTNLSLGLELPFKTNELTTIEYIFYRKALIKKIKQNTK